MQQDYKHPITPPEELVQQWMIEYAETKPNCLGTEFIATCAAQWGADQELEACCAWFSADAVSEVIDVVTDLRAARRPKPPSLKEQALESVKRFEESGEFFSDQMRELEFIRRALEALPND